MDTALWILGIVYAALLGIKSVLHTITQRTHNARLLKLEAYADKAAAEVQLIEGVAPALAPKVGS